MDANQSVKTNDSEHYVYVYSSDLESQYKNDLANAETLWTKDRNDVVLQTRWVKCMHNLAKVYEAQSDHKKTFYYLITPHNWIVNKLHDRTLSEDEITITLNALKITFDPLYEYRLKRPCCNICRQNLEDQRAWFKHTENQLH
jgi:hypothetical protein